MELDKLPIGTIVLCDTQNGYYAARDAYGEDKRIDYLKLRKLIESETLKDPPQSYIDFKAYIIRYPNYDTVKFTKMLKNFSFAVEEKQVAPGSKDNSWASGIIADAIKKSIRYNRFVFVTGDGTVIRAVEALKGMGKEVWGVSFPANINGALAKAVDRTIILNESVIWTIGHEAAVKV